MVIQEKYFFSFFKRTFLLAVLWQLLKHWPCVRLYGQNQSVIKSTQSAAKRKKQATKSSKLIYQILFCLTICFNWKSS